jgi:perosamine synthetase
MSKFIPVAVPYLSGNEKKYVDDCLDSTWISSNGKYIKEFEGSFANWMGIKHAISCCNGTVALHLPLLALDLKEGDEVLVPTFTYIATANAVRYCGATPV